jgi:hypothetical protein
VEWSGVEEAANGLKRLRLRSEKRRAFLSSHWLVEAEAEAEAESTGLASVARERLLAGRAGRKRRNKAKGQLQRPGQCRKVCSQNQD